MSIRSINSIENRAHVIMAKDEFKEALIHASIYENAQSHILSFKSKDMESFSNGNLIGKLIILKKGGYIIFNYSKINNDKDSYQVDNLALTLSGIELLTSYSFVFFSLKSLKHIFLSSIVAIVVVILLRKLGFK